MYDLSGIVLHGGADGSGPGRYGSGHYMAFSRNVRVSGSPWYYSDDANVRVRPLAEHNRQQAYVFFYVRRPASAVVVDGQTTVK